MIRTSKNNASIVMAGLISLFLLSGQAQAATITKTYDAIQDINLNLNSGKHVNSNDSIILSVGQTNDILLKFNISDLPDVDFSKVTLNLFGGALSKKLKVNVSAFNDNWSEKHFNGNLKEINLAEQNPIASDYVGTHVGWQDWDLTSYDFSSDIQDGYLSLLLSTDYAKKALFTSSETRLDPHLTFEYSESTPPAPNPEPSSMVLGVMGLASMLGFRRKK